jgi:hypothetical protein
MIERLRLNRQQDALSTIEPAATTASDDFSKDDFSKIECRDFPVQYGPYTPLLS